MKDAVILYIELLDFTQKNKFLALCSLTLYQIDKRMFNRSDVKVQLDNSRT